MKKTCTYVLTATLGFFFFACSSTRLVKEDEHLLNKVKLHVSDRNIDRDELTPIIKQLPNRKILGVFRFHLWVYNIASHKKMKKDTRFRKWMKNTVGEPPVILNTALTSKSTRQISKYLQNTGYFNNEVSDSTIYRKKKAVVHYYITPNKPYRIRKISFAISDTALIKPIKICSRKSLLLPGNNYNADVLVKERERLANQLRNLGYYMFNKEYILFKVDSSLGKHQVDIKMLIKNPTETTQTPDGKDSIIQKRHELYYVKNIYINPAYNPKASNSISGDTLSVDEYHILNISTLRYKPEIILKNIFIEGSDFYREDRVMYTQKRLNALKTFKFINILFKETSAEEGENMLDCYINMIPTPAQSLTLETQGTNRAGDLGISGSTSFENKNTFKGAEIFRLNLKGGMEVQHTQNPTSSQEITNSNLTQQLNVSLPFNTLEAGADISLDIPSFLTPFHPRGMPEIYDPKTSAKISYNFQHRPDYSRNIATMSYGYSWKGKQYTSHNLDPADINIVKINLDSAFQQTLLNTNNSFLLNSYSDHMIVASRYRFTFSNQHYNKFRNFTYFSSSVEAAGNTLRLINHLIGSEKDDDGSYRFFNTEYPGNTLKDPNSGIQYAQYLKIDADVRYYSVLNKRSNLVYRFYGGIGIPFANLKVLPFEKSFFAGGANGIRAWQVRTLGPGSLADTSLVNIDQIGDIHLEGNMEYRFNLTHTLKGALFADMGNIWLLYIDELTRPGGEFKFNRFWREIALGAGFGLRFDFSFFILRFDLGFPIKDPAVQQGERWIFQSKTLYNALHLSAEKRNLEKLNNEKQDILNEINQNVTGTNPSDETEQALFYNYAKSLADKQLQIIEQEELIGTSAYRYQLKPVLNVGIGFPF